MSAQPLTYESVLELIRENSRKTRREMRENSRKTRKEHQEFRRSLKKQGAEFDRRMEEQRAEFDKMRQETERQKKERDTQYALEKQERDAELARIEKETNKKIGNITGSMGRVIEHMVAGDNIIGKFAHLGYVIGEYSRNKKFGRELPEKLDAKGEIDLFLENGEIAILLEVKTTLETKDVYKLIRTLERYRRFSDTKGDRRRFIGAVAGAVVEDDAIKLALENGMYVIVQSGESVEIVPTPEGFKARKW